MATLDLTKEKTMTKFNDSTVCDLEKKGKAVSEEELIDVEKKVKEAFDDDHTDLAADVYTQSKAPKYVELFEGQSYTNYSTECDLVKEEKVVAAELDELIDVEKKVKQAFNEDHSELAADVYIKSKAPKYSQLFYDQYSPVGSSHNIQARGDLATKEKEDGVLEIAKKAAVVVGVAVVGWGIYKLLGNEGLSGFFGGDPDSERVRKTMKAPERVYRIFRDDFERDPKSYFKELRNSKKGRNPF